ncbi:alpha/beta fold hydrolase [Roseisalinus antarcticus]|uniref:2-hydroxy-6-oxo-6-phenylhexa-2,4-dienoate hydrolase n=1 Tax=Roseisalinus antarcticus TaxID=254357 RepID=A0A1Y5TE62_9RHOB|nr:alpha/beta hydrolase [Roseisalinus antarcticus]SLN61841.1 2-hydroxy-6-oxo-6-phenylhexa-2,4-dienoate hydrolase [Roseisalinus antarcticus]
METDCTIDIDCARVCFDRTGTQGPAVIFVHGGFGSPSELWHVTMQGLPDRYRGYALNNFLRSEPPPDGYTVASFARRLVRFAAELELVRPVIVGHSMGGVVCQLAALEAPDAFGGVVLVSTGPSMKQHGVGQTLLDRLRSEGVSTRLMTDISANWFHRPPPPGFFDAYVARALTAPLEAMIDVQQSLMDTDVLPRLGEIHAPALILHGRQDVGRPIGHAEALREGLPDARLVVFETCGHSPMLEDPAAFDRALADFLDQITEPAARLPK